MLESTLPPGAPLAAALAQLAARASGVTQRHFDAGCILYRQEETARCFFYVISGYVRLFLLSSDGRERTLRILSRGDLVGDAAFYLRTHNATFAEAFEGPAEAYQITRAGYQALLSQDPALYEELLAALARTTQTLTQTIERQTFQDLRERVQMVLIGAAGRYGRASPEGIVIDMHLTHETIASLAGATRARVSVCLSTLQREGFYRVIDQHIVLSLWAAGLVLPP